MSRLTSRLAVAGSPSHDAIRVGRWPLLVIRLVVACAALLLAVPGCGLLFPRNTNSNAAAADTTEAAAGPDVLVEVENHNWNDITVYLLAGGLPQRLGMVTGLSNATFVFPSLRLNTGSGVRLRALPVAGEPYTTETIMVQPGQAIFWTLESDLDTSSFSVY